MESNKYNNNHEKHEGDTTNAWIASPLLSCNNHHFRTSEGSMVHTKGHSAIIHKFDNSRNTITTRLATSDHHRYGYHMVGPYDVDGECYLIPNRYQISNLWHLRDCSTTHMHKGNSDSHTAMKHHLSIIILCVICLHCGRCDLI
jgi:hypothetical protein